LGCFPILYNPPPPTPLTPVNTVATGSADVMMLPSSARADVTALPKVDTNCTAPSLIPAVKCNTVRSFSTHGQQSAAKGSSTTASRSDIRLIQHLDSSALGLVRRWRLIGYSPFQVVPLTPEGHPKEILVEGCPLGRPILGRPWGPPLALTRLARGLADPKGVPLSFARVSRTSGGAVTNRRLHGSFKGKLARDPSVL
jgi:hypothetical protein